MGGVLAVVLRVFGMFWCVSGTVGDESTAQVCIAQCIQTTAKTFGASFAEIVSAHLARKVGSPLMGAFSNHISKLSDRL